MEVKVPEIQPISLEIWTKSGSELKREELVKPVEGVESAKTESTKGEKIDKTGVQTNLLKISLEESKKLTEEIERYLSEINISLNFDIDEDTSDIVVKIINKETGKLIRQIPPEELLRLRKKLEELVGVLFNGKV